MERMGLPPEIVRGQGQDPDRSADPITHKTAVEERPMAAVVLDHEEADEEACRGYRQQQANPIAVVESHPHQRPGHNEGHRSDHQLENAARAIWSTIAGEQTSQGAAFWRALNHMEIAS